MALADEDPGVVDGLGHAGLEYESLEAALEEVLDGGNKDVITKVKRFVEVR